MHRKILNKTQLDMFVNRIRINANKCMGKTRNKMTDKRSVSAYDVISDLIIAAHSTWHLAEKA